MRTLMIAAAVAVLTCSVAAPGHAQTSQKSCADQAAAKNLTGDMLRSFMWDCSTGHTESTRSEKAPQASATESKAQTRTPRERAKDCNTNAANQKLRGQARRDFMSSCLSGGGT